MTKKKMVAKGKTDTDTGRSEPPNTVLLGGRLRSERERLGLSCSDAAQLVGMTEESLASWESASGGQGSAALTLLGHAGADVLYIITGKRNEVGKSDGRPPEDRFRRPLAELAAQDRQRLLLYLVAEELKYHVARR